MSSQIVFYNRRCCWCDFVVSLTSGWDWFLLAVVTSGHLGRFYTRWNCCAHLSWTLELQGKIFRNILPILRRQMCSHQKSSYICSQRPFSRSAEQNRPCSTFDWWKDVTTVPQTGKCQASFLYARKHSVQYTDTKLDLTIQVIKSLYIM